MRLLLSLSLALLPLRALAASLRSLPVPGPAALSCPACGVLSGPVLGRPSLALAPLSTSLAAPALSVAVPIVAAPAAPAEAASGWASVQDSVARLAAAKDEGARQRVLTQLFEHPAADGEAVYPALATPENLGHEREVVAARQELARAAAAALPQLERGVLEGGWCGTKTTLNDSCCGDAAPRLGRLLRQAGHAVDVVEAEFHYYLIYRLPFGEVIIDPTVRQFFGGARAPPDIPKVFVGTVSELNALFLRHAAAKTTSYDVRRIYFRDAQVRNERLSAFPPQP